MKDRQFGEGKFQMWLCPRSFLELLLSTRCEETGQLLRFWCRSLSRWENHLFRHHSFPPP